MDSRRAIPTSTGNPARFPFLFVLPPTLQDYERRQFRLLWPDFDANAPSCFWRLIIPDPPPMLLRRLNSTLRLEFLSEPNSWSLSLTPQVAGSSNH